MDPDSTNSSPHSHDNGEPFPSSANNNCNHHYKVKFMCSYGGKIQPRPHDNQLAYIGGDTKILAVERNIKLSQFVDKLASLCNSDADLDHICVKYQLPGEDLDALISVTNDEDLEHMMLEYDRLYRASSKPARLRLFLFQLNGTTSSAASDDVKSERQWFVDALNSVPVQNLEAPPYEAAGNADFLFGSEKLQQIPEVRTTEHKVEEPNSRVYGVEFYHQQTVSDKIAPLLQPPHVAMPVMMQVPPPYLPERHVTGGIPGNEQAVYQIPYHLPQTVRPITGQVGKGYYGMQQPPLYNQKVGVYSDGIGIMNVETGYMQVGYDGAGRQIYYTTTAAPPPGSVQAAVGNTALNQEGNVQAAAGGGGGNIMASQTPSV